MEVKFSLIPIRPGLQVYRLNTVFVTSVHLTVINFVLCIHIHYIIILCTLEHWTSDVCGFTF